LLLIVFFVEAKAQVQVYEKNVLERIRDGHSHIVVSDTSFKQSAEFLDIFKKYWTLTKGVDYIKESDLPGHMMAGDSYFSLMATSVTIHSSTNIYTDLYLWQPTKKALSDKKFRIDHEDLLGDVILSGDMQTIMNIAVSAKFSGSHFDGPSYFYHWNPGLLKNYLRVLSTWVKEGKKLSAVDPITNKEQLKGLRTNTLYFAKDNLAKMGLFVKAGKEADEKNIFENYQLKYEVISDEDLGEKILSGKEPFYYMLLVRQSLDKLLVVINSQTGEAIYSRYERGFFGVQNIKSGDMKDLYKEIIKN
jgi:hypothetical protein